jgi:hypothetical protein
VLRCSRLIEPFPIPTPIHDCFEKLCLIRVTQTL